MAKDQDPRTAVLNETRNIIEDAEITIGKEKQRRARRIQLIRNGGLGLAMTALVSIITYLNLYEKDPPRDSRPPTATSTLLPTPEQILLRDSQDNPEPLQKFRRSFIELLQRDGQIAVPPYDSFCLHGTAFDVSAGATPDYDERSPDSFGIIPSSGERNLAIEFSGATNEAGFLQPADPYTRGILIFYGCLPPPSHKETPQTSP